MKVFLELFTLDQIVKTILMNLILVGIWHGFLFWNVEVMGNDVTVGKPRMSQNR